jgi:hypothetical protein
MTVTRRARLQFGRIIAMLLLSLARAKLVNIHSAVEQIVGRERRERVSQLDWFGDA